MGVKRAMCNEEQPQRDPQNAADSPFESLLEGLAQSPLYGPLLAPAIRKRQFERRELQRKEAIAQAEFERKSEELRAGKKMAGREGGKPLHKRQDLSVYLDRAELTDKQRECLSLKLEYRWSTAGIARYLSIDRKTVDEHIEAGKKKLDVGRIREKIRKNRAKVQPDQFG
jgi:DNA-binding CsgD family transcriptional regulator